MSSSKGIKNLLDRLCNFPPHHHSPHREPISDSLGQRYNIRFRILPLEPPHLLPQSPEPRLDLIRDTEPSMALNNIEDFVHVSVRQWRHPSPPQNRLSDEASHLLPLLVVKQILHLIKRVLKDSGCLGLGRRIREFYAVSCIFLMSGLADPSQSMVAVLEGQDFSPLGILLGDHNSYVIGLAPRVSKEHCIIILSQTLAQPLRILSLVGVHVNRACVHQFGSLVLNDFRDSRVAMPQVHCGDSSQHVQVPVSEMVPEVLPPAFNQEQRSLVVVDIEVIHVLVPVLENFLIGRALIRRGCVITGWEYDLVKYLGIGSFDHDCE